MDTRQLKYFVQIIESGSISKASRQLCIVQPALSQQLARLEEEVGKPLLLRSARGVVPTENGEALYRHAKFVLRQLDEAVLIARHELGNVRGRVTLGLAASTSYVLGLPLLRQLKKTYPGILLNIVVALPRHLEERARQDQLDLAMLFSNSAARELTFEPLIEEELVVVLPTDSLLVPRSKQSLTLPEAAALPLVLGSAHVRRRMTLEFERAGLEPNIAEEIDSLELVMRYVWEGGGATIQPMAARLAAGTPDGWRCLAISDVQLHRATFLYSLPLQKVSACSSVVRGELKQLVRQLVASGTWQRARLTPPEQESAHSQDLDDLGA